MRAGDGKSGRPHEKSRKTLPVIACVIGVAVGGVCLGLDRRVAKPLSDKAMRAAVRDALTKGTGD